VRRALTSAFGLFAFTLAFTFLMAFTHEVTRESIRAAIEQQQMLLIGEVLPKPDYDYDNALLADRVEAEAGNEGRIGKVWRARKDGAPVALVFETYAPDGYGGRIELIVSLSAAGRIGGVRVASHHETPGLGDYIDPAKDQKKGKPWISQFSGVDTTAPSTRWEVTKDGGFSYKTGATVSARAVTHAVGRAAAWANAHREALFAAPSETGAGQKE
jgi:electron transport complex protein RnfG